MYTVSPFETASNTTAIVTSTNTTTGTASAQLNFPAGTYDLGVNYYDMFGGASHFVVYVNNKQIGEWTSNLRPWIPGMGEGNILGHTPSIYLDGHSATRITFHNVKLAKGDTLKIAGTPDGTEPAPLDYVVVLPAGVVD